MALRKNHPVESRPTPAGTARVLHIATVSAADGVLFTAVEPSGEALQARLAKYVEQNATTMLWPDDADRVLTLLARNRVDAAIDLYFARVGSRWDPEHLQRQVVELE